MSTRVNALIIEPTSRLFYVAELRPVRPATTLLDQEDRMSRRMVALEG